MAKPNKAWAQRQIELKDSLMQIGDAAASDVSADFDKAKDQIENIIRAFYQRFQDKDGIIYMADVKNVKASRANPKTRLDMLHTQIKGILDELYKVYRRKVNKALTDVYVNGYYRQIYLRAIWTKRKPSARKLTDKQIQDAVNYVWSNDGRNHTDFIDDQEAAVYSAMTDTAIKQAFKTGMAPEDTITSVLSKMVTANNRAMSLISAETEATFTKAQFDSARVKR